MSESIIQTRKLSYVYQTAEQSKVALREISLEIGRGSTVAIIGVTGSGKSTLIQHFNGLLKPSEGDIFVDGIEVGKKGADLRQLRQRVGMLFQFPESQLFASSIFEDVAFGPQRMKLGKREVRARVRAALESVGLPFEEYARRSPFELSGGQRRRIALAGVLAMSPTILVLDEPSVGLDADGRAEFYEHLQRIKEERGVTVILVSHDMAEVAALAERLFVLHQGSLVMQGEPKEIFAQGEELRAWGLAVPPLSELLNELRGRGMVVPESVFTLEDAYGWLSEQRQLSGKWGREK